MSYIEYEKLIENSSTTILDTHSNITFSNIMEFLDFCSLKPFDYEEVPTLSIDKIKMGISWMDDDIVFEDLYLPDDDRDEVLTFVFNELEDFFKENKNYFDEGNVFVYLHFISKKIYGGFYYKNPLKFNRIEVENKTFENKLKRKIEDINDQIHIIYNVPILEKTNPKSFTTSLNTIMRDYHLEQTSTLTDFKISSIKEYITLLKGHDDVPSTVINKLITRFTTNTITYSDIKKLPMSEEAHKFVDFIETKKKAIDNWVKIHCIDNLGGLLIDAIKEFARSLKFIFDNFDAKIINNIDTIIKDKSKDSYKVLNNLKDLLDNIDNIGGYDKIFFEDNKFIMLGQLYKKLNFINNNILVINKLK